MSRGEAMVRTVIILALIILPLLWILAFEEMKEISSTDCNPHSQGVNE